VCGNPAGKALLAEAQWYWDREDGACPACVQENLLRTLLTRIAATSIESIPARFMTVLAV
jgi:predicted metal-binding protein